MTGLLHWLWYEISPVSSAILAGLKLFTSASYTVTMLGIEILPTDICSPFLKIVGCILGGNGLHTKDIDAIDPGAATMRRKVYQMRK